MNSPCHWSRQLRSIILMTPKTIFWKLAFFKHIFSDLHKWVSVTYLPWVSHNTPSRRPCRVHHSSGGSPAFLHRNAAAKDVMWDHLPARKWPKIINGLTRSDIPNYESKGLTASIRWYIGMIWYGYSVYIDVNWIYSHEQSVHIQVSCIRELWTVSPMTSKTGLTFSQLNLRLSIAVPFGVFRLGSSEGMNPEWWEISAIFSNSRVSKHQPWNHVTNKNTKWVCLKIGYQRLPHFHPLFNCFIIIFPIFQTLKLPAFLVPGTRRVAIWRQ